MRFAKAKAKHGQFQKTSEAVKEFCTVVVKAMFRLNEELVDFAAG